MINQDLRSQFAYFFFLYLFSVVASDDNSSYSAFWLSTVWGFWLDVHSAVASSWFQASTLAHCIAHSFCHWLTHSSFAFPLPLATFFLISAYRLINGVLTNAKSALVETVLYVSFILCAAFLNTLIVSSNFLLPILWTTSSQIEATCISVDYIIETNILRFTSLGLPIFPTNMLTFARTFLTFCVVFITCTPILRSASK